MTYLMHILELLMNHDHIIEYKYKNFLNLFYKYLEY